MRWASPVTQLVKNPPATWETWVQSLGWEDPWKRERLLTPVFWPGEFHKLYSPWGHKELDMNERLSLHQEVGTLISPFYHIDSDRMNNFTQITQVREQDFNLTLSVSSQLIYLVTIVLITYIFYLQVSTSRLKVKSLSRVQLFVTLWSIAHQAPLSMGFSRQEYWSGLPFPSPGDLPNSGIEPSSPALQAGSLTSELPGSPLQGQKILILKIKNGFYILCNPIFQAFSIQGVFRCSVVSSSL